MKKRNQHLHIDLGNYEIKADSLNYILYDTGKTPPLGYHGTMDSFLKQLVEIKLRRNTDIKTLEKLRSEYLRVTQELKDLIYPDKKENN